MYPASLYTPPLHISPTCVCKDVAEEIVAEANQRMMSVAGGSGGGFATVRTVVGDALVDEGWPMVHAVGR